MGHGPRHRAISIFRALIGGATTSVELAERLSEDSRTINRDIAEIRTVAGIARDDRVRPPILSLSPQTRAELRASLLDEPVLPALGNVSGWSLDRPQMDAVAADVWGVPLAALRVQLASDQAPEGHTARHIFRVRGEDRQWIVWMRDTYTPVIATVSWRRRIEPYRTLVRRLRSTPDLCGLGEEAGTDYLDIVEAWLSITLKECGLPSWGRAVRGALEEGI